MSIATGRESVHGPAGARERKPRMRPNREVVILLVVFRNDPPSLVAEAVHLSVAGGTLDEVTDRRAQAGQKQN